ncbi:hypothetical protein OUZ56_024109 [Daphnia magna]|uniref:Uncharacterized protein n=1 Tax=Daphnia magna TaxID=35525 RepID=A0ABR0B059_9CRUS|nr:hypothetical protein OUZ56_024109 [Daphnia magna]
MDVHLVAGPFDHPRTIQPVFLKAIGPIVPAGSLTESIWSWASATSSTINTPTASGCTFGTSRPRLHLTRVDWGVRRHLQIFDVLGVFNCKPACSVDGREGEIHNGSLDVRCGSIIGDNVDAFRQANESQLLYYISPDQCGVASGIQKSESVDPSCTVANTNKHDLETYTSLYRFLLG